MPTNTYTPTGTATATTISPSTPAGRLTLILRVDSSTGAPQADIKYFINGQAYSAGEQGLPWVRTIELEGQVPLLLQARNLSDSGEISCSITISGQAAPASVNQTNDPDTLLECTVFDDP